MEISNKVEKGEQVYVRLGLSGNCDYCTVTAHQYQHLSTGKVRTGYSQVTSNLNGAQYLVEESKLIRSNWTLLFAELETLRTQGRL